MRVRDTSALLPLFVAEPSSARARSWLRKDPVVVVWTLTRVEIVSAHARRERVRRQAERLVGAHPLRAADALQIGAALVASDLEPAGLPSVTLDGRLALAAEKEGFPVTTVPA